jgi:hypothetical protein
MELRSAIEAIRCHRRIAMVGLALACALALFALVRPVADVPPLELREPPTYESNVRLFITQPGFPWGRSVLRVVDDQTVEGDPSRFASLAVLYAQLANSDAIQRRVTIDGVNLADLVDRGEVFATVVPQSEFSSNPLPLIDVTGRYTSADGAQKLARDTAAALKGYIVRGQQGASIGESDRVVLEIVDTAEPGEQVGSPVLSLPILVFMTIIFLTLGVIFVRHNLERAPSAALDEEIERAGRFHEHTFEGDDEEDVAAVGVRSGERRWASSAD